MLQQRFIPRPPNFTHVTTSHRMLTQNACRLCWRQVAVETFNVKDLVLTEHESVHH